jgi:hypothetical protein
MVYGVAVTITRAHIEVMAPGELRDEVDYAYRTRTAAAASRFTPEDAVRLRAHAELERVRAVLRYADTPATCSDRRDALVVAGTAHHLTHRETR